MIELWLAFSAGLAGSGHCLGMCGGIVSALALSKSERLPVQRFFYNLFYHVGRIITYTLLGLLVGMAAQAGMVDAMKPFMKWLFLAANLFVTAIGIFTVAGIRSFGVSSLDGTGAGFFTKRIAQFSSSTSAVSALPAGLLMGLLPCGLVYGVLISAATAASAFKGAAMMLAFGLGTVPALLAYGQFASTLSALGRGAFQRFMGAMVALLGLVGTLKALSALGYRLI